MILNPIMNAVKAPENIITLDNGIASCTSNFKMRINMGISKPPPPIPPAFEIPDPINIENRPIISFIVGGKKSLCLHL